MNKINYTKIAKQLKVMADPKRLKSSTCFPMERCALQTFSKNFEFRSRRFHTT